MSRPTHFGIAIQKVDFDRMAEGNLEAALNEEPRAPPQDIIGH
jgi:hypothetical protein